MSSGTEATPTATLKRDELARFGEILDQLLKALSTETASQSAHGPIRSLRDVGLRKVRDWPSPRPRLITSNIGRLISQTARMIRRHPSLNSALQSEWNKLLRPVLPETILGAYKRFVDQFCLRPIESLLAMRPDSMSESAARQIIAGLAPLHDPFGPDDLLAIVPSERILTISEIQSSWKLDPELANQAGESLKNLHNLDVDFDYDLYRGMVSFHLLAGGLSQKPILINALFESDENFIAYRPGLLRVIEKLKLFTHAERREPVMDEYLAEKDAPFSLPSSATSTPAPPPKTRKKMGWLPAIQNFLRQYHFPNRGQWQCAALRHGEILQQMNGMMPVDAEKLSGKILTTRMDELFNEKKSGGCKRYQELAKTVEGQAEIRRILNKVNNAINDRVKITPGGGGIEDATKDDDDTQAHFKSDGHSKNQRGAWNDDDEGG